MNKRVGEAILSSLELKLETAVTEEEVELLMEAENYVRAKVFHNPNWDYAPDWANYWAVDQDGQSFWYQREPSKRERLWVSEEGHRFERTQDSTDDDWQDSLRERELM